VSAKKTTLTTLTIIIPTTIVALIAVIMMMSISPPTAANAQNITNTPASSTNKHSTYLMLKLKRFMNMREN
jgi:hypothetical protein